MASKSPSQNARGPDEPLTVATRTALGICSLLATVCFFARPIWVENFVARNFYSLASIGWITAGQVGLFGLTTLVVASLWRHVSPRWLTAAGSAVVVLGCAFAMVPVRNVGTAGILLTGIGAGAVSAALNGIAGRATHSQHVFVLINAVPIPIVSLLYFYYPSLIARFGIEGLFVFIAALGMASFAAAGLALPGKSAKSGGADSSRIRAGKTAPVLAALGLASVMLGAAPIGVYVAVIGSRNGLSTHTVGTALAAGNAAALGGLITARLAGERFGLLKPLTLSLAILAASMLFLLHARSGSAFFAAFATVNAVSGLYVPYALALIAKADPTGGFVSAAPVFVLFPSAAGDKLGGIMMEYPDFLRLGLFIVSGIGVGLVLFVLASRKGDAAATLPSAAKVS